MASRRIAVALAVVVAIGVACGGDDDEGAGGGISLDQPIGTTGNGSSYPSSDYSSTDYSSGAGSPPAPAPSSVVKSGTIDLEVRRGELDSTAQAVVDLATSSKVGGFLISSVLDLDEGNGSGNVVVRVPAEHFESIVGELGALGEVSRQSLEGSDLTYLLDDREVLPRVRRRIASLRKRLESGDAEDAGRLRDRLRGSRMQARDIVISTERAAADAAFATVTVALVGLKPPAAPAPEKPVFTRALSTSKEISLAIASGIVLAAGVVVPIGGLLLVLVLLGAPLIRRIRPRLESSST